MNTWRRDRFRYNSCQLLADDGENASQTDGKKATDYAFEALTSTRR